MATLEDNDDYLLNTRASTLSQVLEAEFEGAVENSATASIYRFAKGKYLESQDDDPLVSPEEANKRYKLETPMDEPMSRKRLEYMEEYAERKRRRQEVIADGDDSLTTSALGLGSSLFGYAIDPIGILTGKLVGGTQMGTSLLNRIGSNVALKGKPFLQGAAMGAAEGAAGNLIEEAAAGVFQELAHEDVNHTENLVMAVAAGGIFGGLIGGVRGWAKGLDDVEVRDTSTIIEDPEFKKASPQEKDLIMMDNGLLEPDANARLQDLTEGKFNSDLKPTIEADDVLLADSTRGNKLQNELDELIDENAPEELIEAKMLEIEEYQERKSTALKEARVKANAPEQHISYDKEAQARIDELQNVKLSATQDIYEQKKVEFLEADPENKIILDEIEAEFKDIEVDKDEAIGIFLNCALFGSTGGEI